MGELRRAVEGPGFTPEVHTTLGEIAKQARLQIADQQRAGWQVYAQTCAAALSKRYISEAGLGTLRELAQAVGVPDAQARRPELDRLRMLSRISDGQLAVVGTHVGLHKGEVAYLDAPARLCHLVTRRKKEQSWTELRSEDSGQVLVTSERLLFVGRAKSVNIKLDKIMTVEPFTFSGTPGVRVHRGTQNPDLFVVHDPELLQITLVAARKAYSS